MLSQAQRTAILERTAKGVSRREIAHVLQVSRQTVRTVLRANSTTVPEIQRAEKAEPYREQILELLASCKGNLVESRPWAGDSIDETRGNSALRDYNPTLYTHGSEGSPARATRPTIRADCRTRAN